MPVSCCKSFLLLLVFVHVDLHSKRIMCLTFSSSLFRFFAKHPIFDAENRRRLHPFDFCAPSFERHGYWAKETVGFTKKLAFARAAALGLDPSAEICRWYGIISCCLQRANAKVLRGEPVPARHSAPPPRFFSLGRDLPLAGA